MLRIGAVALVMLAVLSSAAFSTPLLYQISGVAEYQAGPDTGLDGADISILLGIDSEAEPFYQVGETYAAYCFDVGSVSLTVAGGAALDGTYPGADPFQLRIFLQGPGWAELHIGGDYTEGPPFAIPGTPVHGFTFNLLDGSGEVLDSIAVPTSIDVDAAEAVGAIFHVTTEDGPVYGYFLEDLAVKITPIPEPGTLGLLAPKQAYRCGVSPVVSG